MAASYFLSTDSYICLDRRYCIFLDAGTDKYLAVARQTIDSLAPWLCASRTSLSPVSPTSIPPELATIADDLVRLGALTTSQCNGKLFRAQDIQKPTCDMPTSTRCPEFRFALPLAPAIAWASLWASQRLSNHSLMSTIQCILHRRAAYAKSSPEVDLLYTSVLVKAFNRWHGFFSRPQACLYQSLSLLHFLCTFNIFPSLVFGVISDPFQAHCWLQHREMVINDRLSRVADFTPVMLV